MTPEQIASIHELFDIALERYAGAIKWREGAAPHDLVTLPSPDYAEAQAEVKVRRQYLYDMLHILLTGKFTT